MANIATDKLISVVEAEVKRVSKDATAMMIDPVIVTALIARIREQDATIKRMDEALEILIDPNAGEIDRKLAIKDARAARKEPTHCPCTLIQQDETCPVGYPSLLCETCKGTGVLPARKEQP